MPRRGFSETKTKQAGAEPLVLIRLSADEPEALRVDGVWISPDEEGWVRESEAQRLTDAGQASYVQAERSYLTERLP